MTRFAGTIADMVDLERYTAISRDVLLLRARTDRLIQRTRALRAKARLILVIKELDDIASYVLRQVREPATPIDEALWLHAASERLQIATATVDELQAAVDREGSAANER